MASKKEDLLLRLGSVQLLTWWEGEGPFRHLKARISKLVPEDVMGRNPQANREFTMEDLTALSTLCKEATDQALRRQSVDFTVLKQGQEDQTKDDGKAAK